MFTKNATEALNMVAFSWGRANLQRGDVVFVPKSNVGERIQGVDTYMNQLIPFTKSIGVGYNYTRTSGGNN